MANLTPTENQELSAGRAYLAVYGKMTYRDVFGVSHWTKFCSWVPLNSTRAITTEENALITTTSITTKREGGAETER